MDSPKRGSEQLRRRAGAGPGPEAGRAPAPETRPRPEPDGPTAPRARAFGAARRRAPRGLPAPGGASAPVGPAPAASERCDTPCVPSLPRTSSGAGRLGWRWGWPVGVVRAPRRLPEARIRHGSAGVLPLRKNFTRLSTIRRERVLEYDALIAELMAV